MAGQDEGAGALRRQVRVFEKRKNPFTDYTEKKCTERFRFSKAGIRYLVENFALHLTRPTMRNKPLTPVEQMCLALRFYAAGPFQQVYGDTTGISQAASCKALWDITASLVDHADEYIYLPTEEERYEIKRKFYEIAHFPNIIGLVDGTQIKIKAPVQHEEAYVNRKGYHSVNVQIIVDSNGLIRNVDCSEGSRHDSRILQECEVWPEMNRNADNSVILGDSGYPCRRWLLTPFLAPENDHQIRYNRAHKATRSMIERTIGTLKKRFNCLHQELRFSPEKACRIIIACAVLHNIRKRMGIADDIAEVAEVEEDEVGLPDNIAVHNAMRRYYAQHYF